MAEINTQGAGGAAPRPRKKKKKKSGGAIALTVGKVFGTLILIGICTCAIMACFAAVYIKTVILPQSYVDASTFKMDLSSTIYYNDPDTGETVEWLALHGDENRVRVDYEDIPQDMIHAVVSIEDERFYQHHGVDWKRTAGAFVNMFLGMRNNFGGSTLTQQLIKNSTGQDEVTVQRKILEIFRALEFERNNSKEDILEMYLNYIYLGEHCYGVGTAAQTYFGKDVSQLSLAECASLVGITNNPSAYDPYISETTRQNNKNRQETILWKMNQLGYITDEEYEAALKEPLEFQRGVDETRPTEVYTYYQDEVIRDVIQDLQEKLDLSEVVARQMVYSGGVKIYSCYNPQVQAAVDAIYNDVANLPSGSTSKSGQQLQSAITVIDNATGNVSAMAGGVGEKEGSLSLNRAVKTVRPPGSSIKPLAVYAPALEVGAITPATVFDDSPYNMSNGGWPINSYSGFRGLTTVYEGLQNSVNTVAVKIMANSITPMLSFDFLTKNKDGMGGLGFTVGDKKLVTSKEINGQTYSDIDIAPLALGGLTNGVSTLEMAAAYSTFSRSGVYVEPRTYSRVEDNEGNVILENVQETHTAMKESTAWYINYMLKNAAANGTGAGSGIAGMTVAGKTGTTSSRKDLWFAGYTPYYTAVVWTGYDQQERLASGLRNPSIGLWQKVMSKVHEGLENKDFPEPANQSIVSVTVCKDSGKLPTDECKMDARGARVVTLNVINGDQPTDYCDRHVTVDICLADPFLNAAGEKTGMFHLATEFCPENTETTPGRRTVSVVDYLREGAAATVTTRDSMFMKSYLDQLGDGAKCTVHTTAPTPEVPVDPVPPDGGGGETGAIDPYDPSTWPDDPMFNPFDPSTWPGQTPEVTTTPTVPVNPTPDPGIPTDGGDQPYVPAAG